VWRSLDDVCDSAFIIIDGIAFEPFGEGLLATSLEHTEATAVIILQGNRVGVFYYDWEGFGDLEELSRVVDENVELLARAIQAGRDLWKRYFKSNQLVWDRHNSLEM